MGVGILNRYGLPFSNVVGTGTATNNITPGRTLEDFRLQLGGTFTKAMISMFKMKANGKSIIEASGYQIDAVNAYRGEATSATFLDLHFADYKMDSELDRQIGSFDTSLGISNITTEVTIAGANAPTIQPILIESASQKTFDGKFAAYAPLISKLLSYPFNMSTGGTLPVTVPFGPQNGATIKRMHVFHTGTMTGATVKMDGVVIHESTAAQNQFAQQKAGRVPQSNVYTIDFVLDGNVKKALDTRDAKSLEWLFTFSGAGSGTVLVEYLDVLGNL